MVWSTQALARLSLPEIDERDERPPLSLDARLARGDHAAVIETYRAHHAEVRAFARRLVGDDAIAEDLVHEVFVALPASMRTFRRQCSLKSWLVSIAIRHAQHHVRAAQRRRAAEARLALEPRDEPTRPDVAAEQAELARMLTIAFDALPLDQRVAFVLCEVEERTSVEAAEMLGASDATIRARVFHAKKKLRVSLDRMREEASGKKGEAP